LNRYGRRKAGRGEQMMLSELAGVLSQALIEHPLPVS
jgi:hypothetical protein